MHPVQEIPAADVHRIPAVASARPEGILRRLLRRGQTPGDRGPVPGIIVLVAAAAGLIQLAGVLSPAWTAALIYDRDALFAGQWWRLWTGHLVHYGWLHFAADTGILLYLGRVITWPRPAVRAWALVLMPPVISVAVCIFDPLMIYYAGLSALNLGLFVFHALQSWRRDRTDWLWPVVLLVCLAEIAIETLRGGSGGGLIAFSDPTVRIATTAHVAGGVGGVVLWALCRRHTLFPSKPPCR